MRIKIKEWVSSLSHEGVSYTPDEEHTIEAPAPHAEYFEAGGLVEAPPPLNPDTKKVR